MLKNISLFSSLSEKDLDTLSLFCQKRSVSMGEDIFLKGEEAEVFYIVKSGQLKAYSGDTIYGYIKSGDFFGEMALYGDTKSKRMASVKALEDSELIVMLKFSIDALIKDYPNIYEKIKKVIEKRKKSNERKIKKLSE